MTHPRTVVSALLASLSLAASQAPTAPPPSSRPADAAPPTTPAPPPRPAGGMAVDPGLDALPACLHPMPRTDEWAKARQDETLRRVREAKGPVNVVFIGDSITQGWEESGKEIWARDYAPLGALEIGVGGDRTEHLLWRLSQAPLTPLDPKVIVLMIGTNNAASGRDSGELIIRGVRAVVEELHRQCPSARVLVLDIPPRGVQTNPLRGMVLQVNQALSQVAWPEGVSFVRVADGFVQPDGRIDPAVMPDFLHFSALGYDQWSEGIRPAVTSALRAARRAQEPETKVEAKSQTKPDPKPSAPPAPAPAPAGPPAANPAPRTGT